MRRLLTALILAFCAIYLLGAIYLALPMETMWTLNDAYILDLSLQQQTNDTWQWKPASDRELYAMARTQSLTHKIVFPDLVPTYHTQHFYYQFRLKDRQLIDELRKAVITGADNVHPYRPNRPDEPLPDWWCPTHAVVLERKGGSETYYVNLAEEELAYSTR